MLIFHQNDRINSDFIFTSVLIFSFRYCCTIFVVFYFIFIYLYLYIFLFHFILYCIPFYFYLFIMLFISFYHYCSCCGNGGQRKIRCIGVIVVVVMVVIVLMVLVLMLLMLLVYMFNFDHGHLFQNCIVFFICHGVSVIFCYLVLVMSIGIDFIYGIFLFQSKFLFPLYLCTSLLWNFYTKLLN